MAVWYPATGCSPGRCDESQQTKLPEVTKGNWLVVLSKKSFQKLILEADKLTSKNLKINDALNEDALAVTSVATSSYS